MPIFYLKTCPKTVVSIVTMGKLPDELPAWVHTNCLFCVKSFADCFSGNTAPLHQVFIIELEIPVQGEISDEFMVLESLNTTFIKQIFVYSLQGSKLLEQLFKNKWNSPLPIKIQPSIFPLPPNPTVKRPQSVLFKEKENDKLSIMSDVKKIRTQPPNPSNIVLTKEGKKEVKEITNTAINRLGSYEEHIQLLKSAFREARKSILITSLSINHETL